MEELIMKHIKRNKEYAECIERIFRIYEYYVEELFENIIFGSDDILYSASDVYEMIKDVICFKNLYWGEKVIEIEDYLQQACYEKEEIDIFLKKIPIEEKISENIKKSQENRLKDYVNRIFAVFCEMTQNFLETVLNDDEEDPHFSPNILWFYIDDIIKFKMLNYGECNSSVETYLLKNGYKNEDINLLYKKRQKEREMYPGKFD